MKTALLTLALATLAAVWVIERIAGAHLAIQIAAHGNQPRELTELQHERERLQALQPGADELAKLRKDASVAAQAKTVAVADGAASDATPAPLPLGDWSHASEWKNRGNASPHAAIESALWAAAGGDTAVFKKLLVLSAATREKADALLAQLPAEARARFTDADDLVAEFTIKNIPIGEAQLVWLNQNGDDDANACVFLQQPRSEGGIAPPQPPRPISAPSRIEELSAALAEATSRGERVRLAAELKAERAAHPELVPPRTPEGETISATYLSLHRDADGGWRIVVPVDALAQIAQDLGVTPTP